MRQGPETMLNEIPGSVICPGENRSDAAALNVTVYVYGYGPNKNPFYEEARAVNATETGALLLLSVPVSRGQKLLLMNDTRQDPLEAQVVRSRTMGTQMSEIEVAFKASRADFWRPLRATPKDKHGAEK